MTAEEIVTAFEQDNGNHVALFDRLSFEIGLSEASRLWSEACHLYDRIHMTAEEYEEQYESCQP